MSNVTEMPDSCMVRMDGQFTDSQDFVAVLARDNGDASIYYNTDALTLGMAMKMIAKEFVTCVDKCTPSEQNEIAQILGDAFVLERMREHDEEHRG